MQVKPNLPEQISRQTRDVAGILHFLTPQQMAEEIVRLDAASAALSAAPAQEPAEDNWVAKVVSSGPHDFPLLQWRSADVSLDTPIGTLLYASPLPQEPQEGKALTDERIEEVLSEAYRKLVREQGYSGGMGGATWDLAAARAIERELRGAQEVSASSKGEQR